jgi:ssDNA-binding Zn-finger/Zn-ribbon topoisomerase 1
MAGSARSGNAIEATCPHCRKTFAPDPLARPSARHRGFKCPHCHLFVPVERASEAPLAGDRG